MRLAAVVYQPGDAKAIDALFVSLASSLKARGLKLAGTVQHNADDHTCASMVLHDLASGRAFDISIPGDKKRDACSLEPAALEDVAGQVAASLDANPGVVIINRFGKQEALGVGLRSVIEAAVAAEIPVLTALCATHIDSWKAFTGETDERLPADLAALAAWCTAVALQPA